MQQLTIREEYELAAQHCANSFDPWPESLLSFQVSAECAVLIEIESEEFARRVREIAYRDALATSRPPIDTAPCVDDAPTLPYLPDCL